MSGADPIPTTGLTPWYLGIINVWLKEGFYW